jgi:hypothetical protein
MSILPTKILLATDGSKDAEFATTTAVGLASAKGSSSTCSPRLLLRSGSTRKVRLEPRGGSVLIYRHGRKALRIKEAPTDDLQGEAGRLPARHRDIF